MVLSLMGQSCNNYSIIIQKLYILPMYTMPCIRVSICTCMISDQLLSLIVLHIYAYVIIIMNNA